ncbi:acyltransferase [Armatimonadota bacterium]|nr:acyltransferase [Armatimonadota bacterium]
MPDTNTISSPTRRVVALDVFRGFAALAAVGIHLLQLPLNDSKPYSPFWMLCAVVNRGLLFAVPAFILLTTILLTRKLLKDYALRTYYQKRIQTALYPYLLWSVLHAFLARKMEKGFTWHDALVRISIGKSYYHLYFLGVILQLYLILPFLAPLFRKRPPISAVLPLAIGLTLGFYALNRYVIDYPYPGSILYWYTASVVLGMWLGSQSENLEAILHRWIPVSGIVSLLSACFYLPLAMNDLAHLKVNTFFFQIGEWTYTNSTTLFLLGLAVRVRLPERLNTCLLYVGSISMQMYLLHRFPLWAVDRLNFANPNLHTLLTLLAAGVLALVPPLIISRLTVKTKLSVILFGR